MDPLTAFSLACGVIQVVDFGLQTVSTARVLYKDGSIKNHAQLENLSNDFVTATAKLQKSLGDTGSGSAFSIDPDDQILYDLSTRCNATAKKLLHELDQLSVTADGGRRILQVSKKTLAAIWKAGKIKDLGLTLESYRKALDTQVLISLRSVVQHVPRYAALAFCAKLIFPPVRRSERKMRLWDLHRLC